VPRQPPVAPNCSAAARNDAGTVVRTTVHYAPLPASIIEIHPAWHGYDYVVGEDEVIIVQPHTRKIVEIIVVS
jgi:hypothetical protein